MGAKEVTYAFDLSKVSAPDRAYYANTATFVQEGKIISFAFGQFQVGRRDAVQSAMGLDIPEQVVCQIHGSFNVAFRSALAESMEGYAPMSTFPIGGEQPKAIVYPAHAVKAECNTLGALLDFYDFTLRDGKAEIGPVMRIRCFPPVLDYFMRSCDRVAGRAQ